VRASLIILCGFLILFSTSCFLGSEVKEISQKLQAELINIEDLIKSDQWEEAAEKINASYASWDKAKEWLAILLNHNTLSTIGACYQKLYQFTQHREKSYSLAELNVLILLLKDIQDFDKLKLNNIL